MLRLSEDKLLVVGSMKIQPLPVCGLPSVPKFDQAKLQSHGEFNGASLVESKSFTSLDVKDAKDTEASCAGGDSSIPAFGKLRMLSSEACHKKYVIFDRCEGKTTVILHPSWLNSRPYCPKPDPCFAGDFCGGLQSSDYKSKEAKLNFCSSAALTTVGSQIPVCNEAICKQLPWKMASNKERCSLVDFMTSGRAQNLRKEITKPDFLSDIEEESHNEFHENTEEINALLSSDDEFSTGHSPSDASSNRLNEAQEGHGDKIIGKKRKLGYSTVDDVDDADSGPHKRSPDLPFPSSKRLGSGVSLHFPCESDRTDTFSVFEVSKVCSRGAPNVFFGEKSETESMECSGTFGGGPVSRSKRIKIKNYVQQLKSVVPGADCLDTAGALVQTVQYVKGLQRRLRDLEAVG